MWLSHVKPERLPVLRRCGRQLETFLVAAFHSLLLWTYLRLHTLVNRLIVECVCEDSTRLGLCVPGPAALDARRREGLPVCGLETLFLG